MELLRQRFGLGIAALSGVVGYAIASYVRSQPWQASDALWLRIDALSAIFLMVMLLSLACLTGLARLAWHKYAAFGTLLLAFLSPSLVLICLAFLISTLFWHYDLLKSRRFVALAGQLAPSLLLCCAWLGMGASNGVWNYTARSAGEALASWVFALTLGATLLGGHSLLRHSLPDWLRLRSVQAEQHSEALDWPNSLFGLAWLYPLLRLYSFGPWNNGWSLATLLAGCALCLWSVSQSFQARTTLAETGLVYGWIGLAIATAGLGSATGVSAALVALICIVWLQSALIVLEQHRNEPIQLWLISGAVPITLPFVAVWLAMSAALGAGVLLAAGAFWLLGLSSAIAILRLAPKGTDELFDISWRSFWQGSGLLASLSLILGLWMPGLLDQIILPVARQLQGGLTPYGDLTIWPWLGISAVNSGRQPIAALPSLLLAALMLVLCALAWLTARLFERHNDDQ